MAERRFLRASPRSPYPRHTMFCMLAAPQDRNSRYKAILALGEASGALDLRSKESVGVQSITGVGEASVSLK